MSQTKISIIIPIYNVEKYLSKCLDSVFSQDIPLTDYEVICVNDCSPDLSREIVLEYQKQYENLILIDHKVNSKQGAARNTGLKIAKGKYVWFVDSDDYIETNCLGRLMSVAEKDDLEVLHFNVQQFDERGIYRDYKHFPTETDVITGYEFHKKNDYKDVTKQPWAQLYKKDLLLNNDLLFEENTFYEDAIHTLNATLLNKKFVYISDICYFYRKNPSSVVNNVNKNGYVLANRLVQLIKILQFIDENYPNLESVIAYCIRLLSRNIFNICKLPKDELKIFIQNISKINITNIKKYFPCYIYYFYTHPDIFNWLEPIVTIVFKNSYNKKPPNNKDS